MKYNLVFFLFMFGAFINIETYADSCSTYSEWGDFTSYCTDCTLNKETNTLSARCQDGYRGPYKDTSVKLSDCVKGSLANRGGSLQCNTDSDCDQYASYGNFHSTCSSCKLTNNTFTASCPDDAGHKGTSKLTDFSSCQKGTVSNINGHLTCERSHVKNSICYGYSNQKSIYAYCQNCKVVGNVFSVDYQDPGTGITQKLSLDNYVTCIKNSIKVESGRLTCNQVCSSSADEVCCNHGLLNDLTSCMPKSECEKKIKYKIYTGSKAATACG